MHFTRLKESDEYQRQREELRVAELNLIEHAERVAALRRTLPADTVVDDYQLIDVASGDGVRLSQLFSAPHRPLILCHFMYGKAQTDPCPLCTMWIDGYNAAVVDASGKSHPPGSSGQTCPGSAGPADVAAGQTDDTMALTFEVPSSGALTLKWSPALLPGESCATPLG